LGEFYLHYGKYKKAEQFFKKSLEIREAFNNQQDIAITLEKLGKFFFFLVLLTNFFGWMKQLD
jgi:uncharacterized protein HemY